MCTDSVKFLFSDKFTMSVANNLELLSNPHSYRQSVASGSRGSRSHYSCDRHNSGSRSDRDIEDGDDTNSHHPSRHSRIVKLHSPPRSLAGNDGKNQGGQAEERSQVPQIPGDQVSKVPEGQETLKSHGDPFDGIADFRKHKANMEVYNAFIGHPKKHDPSHVKLKKTGRGMAKRVFHPLEAERWPTKEANAFMNKHLTLVSEQRKE